MAERLREYVVFTCKSGLNTTSRNPLASLGRFLFAKEQDTADGEPQKQRETEGAVVGWNERGCGYGQDGTDPRHRS